MLWLDENVKVEEHSVGAILILLFACFDLFHLFFSCTGFYKLNSQSDLSHRQSDVNLTSSTGQKATDGSN